MDVTPLIPQGNKIIQAYANGHIRVSGETYHGPVAIFSDRVVLWDIKNPADALTAEDFSVVIEERENLDVILCGVGGRMSTMPLALRETLKNAGISVDFMDTGAACRTYNVLMAEGRRVAAVIFPVKDDGV